jgi:transcriptional regulator with XRE-family HTH domain
VPTTDRPDWLDQYRWAVGRRLKELREARGFNQIELALAIGLSDQTISRIENGHRPPNLDQLALLAHGLGIQPWELLRVPGAES